MTRVLHEKSKVGAPMVAVLISVCAGCSAGDADTSGGPAIIESSEHDLFASISVPYRGVNLSGAEWGPGPSDANKLPGVYNSDYFYPDGNTEAAYFLTKKGMNTFRVPFRWERLQRSLNGAFDSTESSRLTTLVGNLTGKGAYVIVDPHNYGRYMTNVIGSSAVPDSSFANFWTKLANLFKSNSKVIFSIMNEPHDMFTTERWVQSENAAIAAIRATGATQLILVQGYHWSGAHDWTSPDVADYGTVNGVAMLNITDPLNNYAYDVHQYLDQAQQFSGSSDQCTSATIGADSLRNFTQWLIDNQRRGFLSEFAGGRNSTCSAAIQNEIAHVMNNPSVYLGWTYWAGGPKWGEYMYTLEPSNGVDRSQMTALLPYLGNSKNVSLTTSLNVDTDDGSRYCATITLTNPSASTVGTWSMKIQLNQAKLEGLWYGYTSLSGTVLNVTASSWNAVIAPYDSLRVGFCGDATGANYHPSIYSAAVGVVLGT